MSTNLLESVSLFTDLTAEERTLVAERFQEKHYTEGETIFHEDAAATALYLLKHGGVRLSIGPIVLATLGVGSVFGESDVFLGRARSIGAAATGPTDVWSLSKTDLDQIVSAHPAIGIKLSQNFGARLVQLNQYLIDARLRNARGFQALNEDELAQTADKFFLENFRAGRTLYRAGNASESLFVIESGRVQIEREGELMELGEGEVLGLMALIAEKAHLEDARAQENTLAWSLSRADFNELTAASPSIRARLSESLHARLGGDDESLAIERLRALPLFSDLDSTVLEAVADRLLLRHVPAGEVIYKEGGIGDALYLVDTGRVEIVSSVVRRGEVLARLGSGGFFGEMALMTGKSRTTGVRAAEDSNLWALYRRDFDDLVAAHPALGQALSQTLNERLRDTGDSFAAKHLRKISLFSGLTSAQLGDVAEHLFPARYRADEVIYKQGASGDRLYLIETGTVRLGASEGSVTRLSDGDFFGETSLLTGASHEVTAVAETDTEIWGLTREEFEGLALQYPVLALNLSRALTRRPRFTTETLAQVKPVSAPIPPVVARTRPAADASIQRAAPAQPKRTAVPVVSRKSGIFETTALWYGGLSRWAKVRLVLATLLFVWLLGIALPLTVATALRTSTAVNTAPEVPKVAVASASNSVAPVAVALANRQVNQDIPPAPTSTYTPAPTETPIPTDTPTDTPIPTATPTDTPVPTATPTDTPVPPTATPRPVARAAAVAAPVEPPTPSVKYSLIEMRRLTPCENRGKHNIFVRVIDPAGNGVNGLWAVQAAANNAGQIMDNRQTEDKDYWVLERQAGRTDFAMFKGAEYMVFISEDGTNPANSDVALPLHSNFTDEANCSDGGGGNTLFHNSFSVVFQKNF